MQPQQKTAMILGLTGAGLGILYGFLLTAGSLVSLGSDANAGLFAGFGITAFLVSGVALAGGLLAGKLPGASAIMMLTAGIVGFIPGVFVFWIPSGALLIVAAVYEFRSREAAMPVTAIITGHAEAQQPARFCSGCGAALPIGAKYCPNCKREVMREA